MILGQETSRDGMRVTTRRRPAPGPYHRPLWWALVLVAGCTTTPPSPRQPVATSPPPQAVVVPPAGTPATPSPSAPAGATPGGAAVASRKPTVVASAGALAAFPAGAQYVCVSGTASERRQAAIEFTPQVADLCRRHPEMGPCQYQREACRRSGGRVFTADGLEITPAVEAEYDKRVTRIRMRGD